MDSLRIKQTQQVAAFLIVNLLGVDGVDFMKFVNLPKRYGYSRTSVIRASLECLRRTLPDKLIKTPVTLKAGDADMKWMSAIIREFNEHDRSKEFYSAPK